MGELLTLVVVICTRNRPVRLRSVVTDVLSQTLLPDRLIVVDSSENPEPLDNLHQGLHTTVRHIRSTPGLPHQRNVGLTLLMDQPSETSRIVLFLDDDLSVPSHYCENLLDLFRAHKECIGIGGFDLNLRLRASTVFERLFHLRGADDSGALLKSAIAIPPSPTNSLETVDWFAGHSMAFREEIFKSELFNENIRMYGEDVDFLLRASKHGQLATSSKLGVLHEPEPTGREDTKVSEAFNHGFRLSLARAYPDKFSKALVLLSTLCLLVYYLASAALRLDCLAWARARGILTFFARFCLSREVVQRWPI
jgi:GT2 family glycosyltransferase